MLVLSISPCQKGGVIMQTIAVIGLDIGKSVFHRVGFDAAHRPIVRRRFGRSRLTEFVANSPPCLIGMEACAGAHHLAHSVSAHGHDVRLLEARAVKAYARPQKNDFNDAEAIAAAVTRPTLRFVAVKTVHQQDRQGVHRARQGLIESRTALVNQSRGFLLEYGLVVPKGLDTLRRALPDLLADTTNALTPTLRALLAQPERQGPWLDAVIAALDAQLAALCAEDDRYQRLQTLPGVGPVTAAAIIATVGDARPFRSARQLAAYLGLVPRQHSTGGRTVRLGITRRGDAQVRSLLVQGARNVLHRVDKRQDRLGDWGCDACLRAGLGTALPSPWRTSWRG